MEAKLKPKATNLGQNQHGPLAALGTQRPAAPCQSALRPLENDDLIAALRCDRIDAPFVFNQPINAASFTAWVEQQLCTTLGPGDIVVMDNLSSHKRPAVRDAIRARGARLLFLPPYSPDLNPIEQVFAKLKHLLRKAAERSVETTWRRIGSLLDAFPPDECANYLKNSGYASR